jgi:hypothetical protein
VRGRRPRPSARRPRRRLDQLSVPGGDHAAPFARVGYPGSAVRPQRTRGGRERARGGRPGPERPQARRTALSRRIVEAALRVPPTSWPVARTVHMRAQGIAGVGGLLWLQGETPPPGCCGSQRDSYSPWAEPVQGGQEPRPVAHHGKTRKPGYSKRTWRSIRTGADPLDGLAAVGRGDM